MSAVTAKTSSSYYSAAQAWISKAGIVDEETEISLFDAMITVPRHHFVLESHQKHAFEDTALPVGFNQSSHRPSLIARMLGLAGIAPGMKVLEVGSNSGYGTALIAQVGAYTYGMEKEGLLAQRARRLLDILDYHQVLMRSGDGNRGWLEYHPYDSIVMWNPVEKIPSVLLNQLSVFGGRLVALCGTADSHVLTLIEQRKKGSFQEYHFERGHLL